MFRPPPLDAKLFSLLSPPQKKRSPLRLCILWILNPSVGVFLDLLYDATFEWCRDGPPIFGIMIIFIICRTSPLFFNIFFRAAACNSVFAQALLRDGMGFKDEWESFTSVVLLARSARAERLLDPNPNFSFKTLHDTLCPIPLVS